MERQIGEDTKNLPVLPNIRKELTVFSEIMEYKLSKNDEERGDSWKNEDFDFFISRLKDEIKELEIAIKKGKPLAIEDEAADVANFAMMIQWKARDKWVSKAVQTMWPESASK